MDDWFRCEPEGDATRFVLEADYEPPAKLPGFVKRAVASGWIERGPRWPG